MADNIEIEVSLSQHLREAEKRLKEFGSVISTVTNHGPQDEVIVTFSNKKAVQELEAEKDAVSFKIISHKKSIKLLDDELSHLLKEKVQLNDVPDSDIKEVKTKQLETEDLMFRKHLGMEIRKVKGGCLQVAFSQIDHKQPNSLFLFSLKFDENRHYIVSDCKPPISYLDNIVHKLNTDNNFQKFIHTMRKRFKDSVA